MNVTGFRWMLVIFFSLPRHVRFAVLANLDPTRFNSGHHIMVHACLCTHRPRRFDAGSHSVCSTQRNPGCVTSVLNAQHTDRIPCSAHRTIMKKIVRKLILAIVPPSNEPPEKRYVVGVPSKFLSYTVRPCQYGRWAALYQAWARVVVYS